MAGLEGVGPLRRPFTGLRLVGVEARVAHGSRGRVTRELSRLGFSTANTNTIERRNATARSMDATSVRKTLASPRLPVRQWRWGRGECWCTTGRARAGRSGGLCPSLGVGSSMRGGLRRWLRD